MARTMKGGVSDADRVASLDATLTPEAVIWLATATADLDIAAQAIPAYRRLPLRPRLLGERRVRSHDK
ncbi:MAG: hypothetical protein WBE50_04835 [Methyloceanibacter sp.]